MRALLLLTILALSGCVGTEEPTLEKAADEPAEDWRCAMPESDADVKCGPALGRVETPAPRLEVGRAWTYQARQTYNPDAEFTVVVAEADAQGYLFAGGAEDDLVHHALWGSEWHGRHTPDLNVPDWSLVSFQFPLYDGRDWMMTEDLQVRASATTLQTPVGPVPGFVVEGRNERVHVRYEYADAVGYYVSYLFEVEGRVHEQLTLTRMETARGDWFWFERGELAVASAPHEPAVFTVPEGFDHVLVSVGGVNGSRALVAPPTGAGQPWATTFEGEAEEWRHGMLPSVPGQWAASVQGWPFLDAPVAPPAEPPVGWAYLHAAPVTWVHHMA